MAILTLNVGSSSIKFAIFSVDGDALTKKYVGLVDQVLKKPVMLITNFITKEKYNYQLEITKEPYEYAIQAILDWLKNQNIELIAAGSRMIHCGTRFKGPVIINNEILDYLKNFNVLAPLHQPYNIMGCNILHKVFPKLLQIVCFDTSFHTSCNKITQLFALPQKYTKEGIYRYGFHGLSYEYVVSQFDYHLKDRADGKVIIMHLGGGSTMCAVDKKRSVATSVGFSGVDGLVMGTRCGSIDAGVLLYLMEVHKMSYHDLTHLLYYESGLLGVSGISSDMRELLASNSADAKLAIDLYVYRIVQWIGTLAMELQGLDGIVFTAGIGENSSYIRAKICERASWLGVNIDHEKNNSKAIQINTKESKVGIYVIPTDEEATIARDTLKLVNIR